MSTRKAFVDSSDVSGSIADLSSTVSGLTATGTNQATALQLDTTTYQRVATVAASTAVRLPAAIAGSRVVVFNAGANSLNVYPISGAFMNGTANAAQALAANKGAEFICCADTFWTAIAGA
jgi:hypothetical protein